MNQLAIKGRGNHGKKKEGKKNRGREKHGREKNTERGRLNGRKHLRGKPHGKRVVSTQREGPRKRKDQKGKKPMTGE